VWFSISKDRTPMGKGSDIWFNPKPGPMVLKKRKNQVIEATRQLFQKTCLFFPKIQKAWNP